MTEKEPVRFLLYEIQEDAENSPPSKKETIVVSALQIFNIVELNFFQ